ncbi:MAG: hypothetical protein HQM09_17525 [Candidatus Riflebacteria bacterium]|nr:hypothetical protein [Candidatus Riflebacteria bacterium]
MAQAVCIARPNTIVTEAGTNAAGAEAVVPAMDVCIPQIKSTNADVSGENITSQQHTAHTNRSVFLITADCFARCRISNPLDITNFNEFPVQPAP